MLRKITVSPITRISGLLSIDIYADETGRAKEANVIGEQFRGFEAMMKGRRITDAVYFTQRICGICSMAHGFTAARLVEQIYGMLPTPEMLLLQQAMLGAEFLQNHIRHFYLLALPDYLGTGASPIPALVFPRQNPILARNNTNDSWSITFRLWNTAGNAMICWRSSAAKSRTNTA
jgi:hydrogenase large subunit